MMPVRFVCAALVILVGGVIGLGPMPAQAEPVSFSRQIAPLLLDNCLACHGPKRAESAYRVDSFERTLHAGESEDAPVTAGKPKESELLRRLASTDPDERMPKDGEPFKPEQLALVQRWIDEGATFDGPTPQTPLASLVPAAVHPAAPASYLRPMPITAVLFSADGQELFVGGFHEITVWNPASGEPLRRFGGEGERTFALALAHDGKSLLAASGAPGRLGEVRLFDAAAGSLTKVLARTTDVVFDVAAAPQDSRIALASADNTVRVVDSESGQEKLTIANHADWVYAVAWSPDGKQLVSGARDKTAKVFDAASGENVATFSAHADAVRGVMFHPDGKQVFSCGADRRVSLWKVADPSAKPTELKGLGGEAFKLIAGKEFFFIPAGDKLVYQFDPAAGTQVRKYAGPDWMISAAYHAGTHRLAAGCFDGSVHIWDTTDGKLLTTFFAAPGYTPPAAK